MKFTYKGKRYKTRKWVDYMLAIGFTCLVLAFAYWYLWIYYPYINHI